MNLQILTPITLVFAIIIGTVFGELLSRTIRRLLRGRNLSTKERTLEQLEMLLEVTDNAENNRIERELIQKDQLNDLQHELRKVRHLLEEKKGWH